MYKDTFGDACRRCRREYLGDGGGGDMLVCGSTERCEGTDRGRRVDGDDVRDVQARRERGGRRRGASGMAAER